MNDTSGILPACGHKAKRTGAESLRKTHLSRDSLPAFSLFPTQHSLSWTERFHSSPDRQKRSPKLPGAIARMWFRRGKTRCTRKEVIEIFLTEGIIADKKGGGLHISPAKDIGNNQCLVKRLIFLMSKNEGKSTIIN